MNVWKYMHCCVYITFVNKFSMIDFRELLFPSPGLRGYLRWHMLSSITVMNMKRPCSLLRRWLRLLTANVLAHWTLNRMLLDDGSVPTSTVEKIDQTHKHHLEIDKPELCSDMFNADDIRCFITVLCTSWSPELFCNLDLFPILFVSVFLFFLCLYLCSFYLYLVYDLIINNK